MKAKLKLLISMSYDAKLLLLDEPTVGLDSVIRSELLDEMREPAAYRAAGFGYFSLG